MKKMCCVGKEYSAEELGNLIGVVIGRKRKVGGLKDCGCGRWQRQKIGIEREFE